MSPNKGTPRHKVQESPLNTLPTKREKQADDADEDGKGAKKGGEK